MDARDLKRRAGIIVEGVDVDSVSAELARANKQELASILSKAAATSSDMYGDAVIVQAFQAAIDQLSGGGLYEEETDSAMPKTIKVTYFDKNGQDKFYSLESLNAQGEIIGKFRDSTEANQYINGLLKNEKVYLKYATNDAMSIKPALEKELKTKGISLDFIAN